MHERKIYGPDKLNLRPLLFDLQVWPYLPEQMFQTLLLLLKDNNFAISFLNPCINIEVMAQTSSIYDHFIN